jgi:hypothetical protein
MLGLATELVPPSKSRRSLIRAVSVFWLSDGVGDALVTVAKIPTCCWSTASDCRSGEQRQ